MTEIKCCVVCKNEKPIECFRVRSDTGRLRGRCKDCDKVSSKKAQEKAKLAPDYAEKTRAYQRIWCKNNPEKRKKYAKAANVKMKENGTRDKWVKNNPEKAKRCRENYDNRRKEEVRLAILSAGGLIGYRKFPKPPKPKRQAGISNYMWTEEDRLAVISAGGHWPKTRQVTNEFTGKGRGSHRKGKTTFDLWVRKYGLEEAEKRQSAMRDKMSKKRQGTGNSQYGKAPSCRAHSRGLSGWYKGHHFRSMNELTFMIELDCSGVELKSAEHLSIPYCYGGEVRTYHPDFIVGTRIIEIKPKRLQKSPDVQAKKRGAEIFCLEKGFSYEMIHVQNNYDLIDKGLASGTIEFSGDCLSKYKARRGSRRK